MRYDPRPTCRPTGTLRTSSPHAELICPLNTPKATFRAAPSGVASYHRAKSWTATGCHRTRHVVPVAKGAVVAFGKTEEQKQADRQQQQQQAAIKAQAAEDSARQKAYQDWLQTPVGQAASAWDQGQGFFEIQLQVGSSHRDSTIWGTNNTTLDRGKSQTHAGTLSGIEAQGWRLETTGYVSSRRARAVATNSWPAVSRSQSVATQWVFTFSGESSELLNRPEPLLPSNRLTPLRLLDPAQQPAAPHALGAQQWQPTIRRPQAEPFRVTARHNRLQTGWSHCATRSLRNENRLPEHHTAAPDPSIGAVVVGGAGRAD